MSEYDIAMWAGFVVHVLMLTVDVWWPKPKVAVALAQAELEANKYIFDSVRKQA